MFPVESRDRCEELLEALKVNKVGRRFHSVVSVLPCSIYCHASAGGEEKEKDSMTYEDDSAE